MEKLGISEKLTYFENGQFNLAILISQDTHKPAFWGVEVVLFSLSAQMFDKEKRNLNKL